MVPMDEALLKAREAIMNEPPKMGEAFERVLAAAEGLDTFFARHPVAPYPLTSFFTEGGYPIMNAYRSSVGAWRETAKLAVLMVSRDESQDMLAAVQGQPAPNHWQTREEIARFFEGNNETWTSLDDQFRQLARQLG